MEAEKLFASYLGTADSLSGGACSMKKGNNVRIVNHGRWSARELEIFEEGFYRFGKEWKLIAELIGTRTIIQVRTHAQKYFQKLAKTSGGPVMSTSKKQIHADAAPQTAFSNLDTFEVGQSGETGATYESGNNTLAVDHLSFGQTYSTSLQQHPQRKRARKASEMSSRSGVAGSIGTVASEFNNLLAMSSKNATTQATASPLPQNIDPETLAAALALQGLTHGSMSFNNKLQSTWTWVETSSQPDDSETDTSAILKRQKYL